MNIIDLLKYLGGGLGLLAVFGGGLFVVGKFRNSKLRKAFETLSTKTEENKEQVHKIEVSIGKTEQQKEDLREQIDQLDAEKKPEHNNQDVLDMFDKLTKKD